MRLFHQFRDIPQPCKASGIRRERTPDLEGRAVNKVGRIGSKLHTISTLERRTLAARSSRRLGIDASATLMPVQYAPLKILCHNSLERPIPRLSPPTMSTAEDGMGGLPFERSTPATGIACIRVVAAALPWGEIAKCLPT